uniref:Uncharacterized protein n=1 Tax=Fagus sylvatica TaxID=28930 RepID=A0A2N9EXW8_FAGSY
MVSKGNSGSSVHSADLPEGLSDRGESSRSSEETPSVSGSLKASVSDSQRTSSFGSLIRMRERVRQNMTTSLFMRPTFERVSGSPCNLLRGSLVHLNFSPAQLAPNAWRTAIACMVMWKVCSKRADSLIVDELLFCYKPCQIAVSPGFWTLNVRQRGLKLVIGLPSSNREWKDDYIFVCGDNWEGRPWEEKDDNFVRVRREWGVPSSTNELLFCYKPCQIAVSLGFWTLNVRQKGLKLVTGLSSSNREWKDDYIFVCGDNWEGRPWEEKDDNFVRKDEAPISLGKRRKTDSSSKKVVEERGPPPPKAQELSFPEPAPAPSVELVEIPSAPSSSKAVEKVPTLPKDPSLGLRRAKSVVTKDDVDKYAKLNTDVVKRALTHSLMKGLTEAMVIANRCMLWEDGLVKLKAQMSEAAKANQKLTTVANELTLDRDWVVGELSSLKADMVAKDAELRKALADNKDANERLKMLTNQLETIKISAVEEFKSSEAYDDNNTKYFLVGFELLRKQAKEKYSDLDFEVFQLYEDDESMMPPEDGNEGTTSTDPQMDDDATS